MTTTPLLSTEAQQTQGQETVVAETSAPVPVQQQEKTEAKPTDTKTTDKVEVKANKLNAPEAYTIKPPRGLPEGQELDKSVMDSFQSVARELDLSNDNAQKLVDQVMPVMNRRALEQQAELHAKWIEAVKTDKEIGGQKLDENLAIAKRAIKAHGDADLQDLFNGPLGSNPAMLRFLVKAGRTVSPDRFVGGNPPGSSDLTDPAVMARKLYPNSIS